MMTFAFLVFCLLCCCCLCSNLPNFAELRNEALPESEAALENLMLKCCDETRLDYQSTLPDRHALIRRILAVRPELVSTAPWPSSVFPLFFARDDSTIRLLIQHGADPVQGTDVGQTALHVACFNQNLDLVRCFLNHGANLQAKNLRGKTAASLLTPRNLEILLTNSTEEPDDTCY